MTIEKKLIDILEASTDPAIMPARKSFGYEVQDDEKIPTLLPLIILQRASRDFVSDICGTYLGLAITTVVVIHIHRDADACVEQADATAFALCTSTESPALETDDMSYDADIRAWMVTQTYRVT